MAGAADRNDSMRLVHLLIDPELKPAFLSMEPQPHRAAMEPNVLTYKQFWALAAAKFNDDDWQPPHLFPNDPHLARCRSFTPTKKSKEVDPNYLREKYKALRRQFNTSVKRWEEGGQNKMDNFWKCSGVAPGTSDEGCWYMFLVLWVGKHEDVLNVILDKQMDGSHQPFSPRFMDGMGRGTKRGRFDDEFSYELQMEQKMESVLKQQTEVLNFVQACYAQVNAAMDEDQRAFWRAQLVIMRPPQPPPPPANTHTHLHADTLAHLPCFVFARPARHLLSTFSTAPHSWFHLTHGNAPPRSNISGCGECAAADSASQAPAAPAPAKPGQLQPAIPGRRRRRGGPR
mmetsp:Transcript_14332/g.28570  ORF Transcript_14332/g.28570 Transcript_14332/m.28570 type:complete len:343 (+) Transcript_14332:478-1506(+)